MNLYAVIKQRVLPVVGAMVLCWACTRPVSPEFPTHRPRLVLHSFTSVGDTFKVSLDQSVSIDQTVPQTPLYVRNALVLLYEDGALRDTLKYDGQLERYVSAAVVAREGRTYRIKASVPSFDPIEAASIAPAPVPLGSITRARSRRTLNGGWPLDDVKFSLNDPQGRNYYMASLFSYNSHFCVYTSDVAFEKFTGDVVPFDQNSCIMNTELLFSDKLFTNTPRELSISTPPENLQTGMDINGNRIRPYLSVHHVNEDFYHYIREGVSTDYSMDSPSFYEPIRIRGNVVGGYGMFTVFATTTDTIP
jgi:hypothetical protein